MEEGRTIVRAVLLLLQLMARKVRRAIPESNPSNPADADFLAVARTIDSHQHLDTTRVPCSPVRRHLVSALKLKELLREIGQALCSTGFDFA